MKKKWLVIPSVIIWLIIWHIAALLIDKEIFLPGPVTVVRTLFSLGATQNFWKSILISLSGIATGFGIGLVSGIILAALACTSPVLRSLIDVPVKVIKAIPVASFVILALLWTSSRQLPILIAALMVMPIIYTNVRTGIEGTDPLMLEMASVYHMSRLRRIRYIYIPALIPALISGCQIAAGYAWKSGIAAEIIGLVRGSIGSSLYQSKLYLEIPQLFAWTIAIVLVSIAFEKIIVLIVRTIGNILGGVYNG